MDKLNENFLNASEIFLNDSGTFVSPKKINLEEPLQNISNMSQVRGQALSVSYYTAGDTKNFGIKPIKEAAQSQLPTKISKRYSPMNFDDYNIQRASDPLFDNFANSNSNRLYPQNQKRYKNLEELNQEDILIGDNEYKYEDVSLLDKESRMFAQHLGVKFNNTNQSKKISTQVNVDNNLKSSDDNESDNEEVLTSASFNKINDNNNETKKIRIQRAEKRIREYLVQNNLNQIPDINDTEKLLESFGNIKYNKNDEVDIVLMNQENERKTDQKIDSKIEKSTQEITQVTSKVIKKSFEKFLNS